VHAGNAERLKKSYFDIVRKVAMHGCDAPQTNVLQLVKDWLEGEESGRWLLVIDNADNMILRATFLDQTTDRYS